MANKNKMKITLLILMIVLLIVGGFFIVRYLFYSFITPNQSTNGSKNSLKLPKILEDMDPAPDSALFSLEAADGQTRFWTGIETKTLGFNGTYLGPVIRFRRGEQVRIQVKNSLSEPTTVHWHGLVVPGDQDGGPHQMIDAGETWNPEFIVQQPAATLWYHPHMMGSTAEQVYAGLAGLIYIDDDISKSLGLPSEYGVNDFPLIVQDRNFEANGQFAYLTSMMGLTPGNTILVNGTINPTIQVNKGKIRFRILNASNSENYTFHLSDNGDFQQIASDNGFLAKPVTRSSLFLAPGERAEIVVDFAQVRNKSVKLMLEQQSILEIVISNLNPDQSIVPASLASIIPLNALPNETIRFFELQSMGINGTINGKRFDMTRIDETVYLHDVETWVIRNRGGMMMQTGGHPFHVHGTRFQVISRNGKAPPPEEGGFKDTVYVDVGEEVKIRIQFDQPGIFMYHCHILEHEESGMMGQILVK